MVVVPLALVRRNVPRFSNRPIALTVFDTLAAVTMYVPVDWFRNRASPYWKPCTFIAPLVC